MSKLTPFILVIFSVVLFFVFIDPQYDQVKALREEKSQYDTVLAKTKTLLAKRDDLQKKYRAIPTADINRIQAMIPDNLDNVKLVLDVDRMAATYGMAIKNIAINSGAKSADSDTKTISVDNRLYDAATITFSVSAPYDTFVRFLRDLEDGLRLIDVNALTIASKDGRVFDYTVTFKTYWLK